MENFTLRSAFPNTIAGGIEWLKVHEAERVAWRAETKREIEKNNALRMRPGEACGVFSMQFKLFQKAI